MKLLYLILFLTTCASTQKLPWENLTANERALMAEYDCESATALLAHAKSNRSWAKGTIELYEGNVYTQHLTGPNWEELAIWYYSTDGKSMHAFAYELWGVKL